MDHKTVMGTLRNKHGEKIDNLEGHIGDILGHHKANNYDKLMVMFQQIGQPDLALDLFACLFGGTAIFINYMHLCHIRICIR